MLEDDGLVKLRYMFWTLSGLLAIAGLAIDLCFIAKLRGKVMQLRYVLIGGLILIVLPILVYLGGNFFIENYGGFGNE